MKPYTTIEGVEASKHGKAGIAEGIAWGYFFLAVLLWILL